MSDSLLSTSTTPTEHSSLTEWLDYMQQIHVSAIDMGLSRVLPVAEALGVVQSAKDDAYVFTVAGTNGKGSTTAVIAQMCQAAGYKTGSQIMIAMDAANSELWDAKKKKYVLQLIFLLN